MLRGGDKSTHTRAISSEGTATLFAQSELVSRSQACYHHQQPVFVPKDCINISLGKRDSIVTVRTCDKWITQCNERKRPG
ncbi:hypothetical protein ElyMa_004099300 [Elysia marginata]|uniref:Uncharacterized protein n=1 Tax=Elysia marginata TaxID=1093978 RepID=A0AAV4GBI8_9GAST|nr:hypothetical protein ElyMa_004099300 [Elysia marginata]